MGIGNVLPSNTVLRLEARKSFVLGLHIYDPRGRTVDLTGCELTIVAKPLPINDDSDASNFLDADKLANIPTPTLGYALFNIQAATLDVTPGEYPFAIVLKTANGYSGIIVKGQLIVEQNVEYSSVLFEFDHQEPNQSIDVHLRNNNTIQVFVGGQLPPGMNYVRDDVMQAIETFDPLDVAYVPDGGAPGYVLTKLNGDDYAMEWRPVGNGAFSLDATGQPAGRMPVAQGDGTWTWDEAGIDATGVVDGWVPVAQGDGTWAWQLLDTAPPDWTAAPGAPGAILHKPTLGTIAEDDKGEYYASTVLVSAMTGWHFQTTVPVSGTNGHIYAVYTP